MRVIAKRQLTGDWGTVGPGEEFNCSPQDAEKLLAAGVIQIAAPPKIIYETKVVVPETREVVSPFRDGSLSDAKSEAVAPEGDSVVPVPDVPPPGNADPGRRSRRSGFSPRR